MGFMDAFLHVAGQGMIFASGSPGARVEAGFHTASWPEKGPQVCGKNDAEIKDLGKMTSGRRCRPASPFLAELTWFAGCLYKGEITGVGALSRSSFKG
jgi:hypothetical protein